MRFTATATTILALFLSVTSVVAQDGDEVTCDDAGGGPNAGDVSAVIAAFESRYLPDGFYRPQGGETLCIKCGNAEINAQNTCAVQYEASRDQVLDALHEMPENSNGCSNLIHVGAGADAGCLPILLATVGYYQPGCEISC